MNTNKTNMTNKSSKLIAILMLICIMISSLCMGCQKEVDERFNSKENFACNKGKQLF